MNRSRRTWSHISCALLVVSIAKADCFLGRVDADSKMQYHVDWLKDALFEPVTFESLAGRYTIFDQDYGAEQSQRNARSRQCMRELFDGVVDHVMPQLSDGAPDIPEKLGSAIRALSWK